MTSESSATATEGAPFGITVCGIEELAGHGETRASHVLSILDPDHPVPEAFGTWGEHEKLELRFHDIIDPQPGMIAPSAEDVARVLAFGRDLAAAAPGQAGAGEAGPGEAGRGGARLLVHCHAGISRSTAAMTLILAVALPGEPADQVLARVHAIREKAWPNLRMIELGDEMLGRGGTLVAAAHRLHGLQLERRPDLAAFMEASGRGREIAGAIPAA